MQSMFLTAAGRNFPVCFVIKRRKLVARLYWSILPILHKSVAAAVRYRRNRCQTGGIVEVGLVEPEAAVGPQVDQMLEDPVRIARYAVGGQAHQLVLAMVHREAAVVGERRVEQAE